MGILVGHLVLSSCTLPQKDVLLSAILRYRISGPYITRN